MLRRALTHVLQVEGLFIVGTVLAVSAALGSALGGQAGVSIAFGAIAAVAFGVAITRAALNYERTEQDGSGTP